MDVTQQLNATLSERYEIEREIGSGGMATVYLARDLKHRRKVALKVLRPELGAVLGPDRFLSEINTTANLQHPHLLPLFDSGEANGLLFFVMPYVEGESLRDRLERERQLPVEEAVRIGVAVASALDYAHRHNVIHRDLKPENILLHEGEPLIADFGIALAVRNAGGARVTQTGLSLGTPQYMSPEQATGDRQIDARSDIYSLAAVIYEMLTGDPPHTGSTVQAVIAKVLTDRPAHVRLRRETVPEHVDAALMCALAKLPADRFATAGEFAAALTGSRKVTQHERFVAAHDGDAVRLPRRRLREVAPWVVAVVASIIAVALWLWPEPLEREAATIFPLTFSDSVNVEDPQSVSLALSRDGSQLAFMGSANNVRGIFIRRMNELQARRVRGTEGGSGPSFSPDGNWLLFHQQQQVKKVPVSGGTPIPLGNSMGGSSWTDRNEVVFVSGDRLYRVSAEGGEPILLATPDTARGYLRFAGSSPLPGGKAVLVSVRTEAFPLTTAKPAVVTIPAGKFIDLGIQGGNARFVWPDHIVFARDDGTLFAAPFSVRRLRLTGPIRPVLDQVQVNPSGSVDLAISYTGKLVYKTGQPAALRVVSVDRAGKSEPLINEPQPYSTPRVAPSGRRLAIGIGPTPGNSDIWTYELGAKTLTPLTRNRTSSRPEWSPDGNRVAYVQVQQRSISWQPWDASGVADVLIANDSLGIHEISFGPKGTWMAVRRGLVASPSGMDIWIAPSDSPAALRPFLTRAGDETMPRISPNGRLLAYVSNESGLDQVYLRTLPGPGPRIQVSTAGGTEPLWSPKGDEIIYRAPNFVVAAALRREPELEVTRRDTLFPDRFKRSGLMFRRPEYDIFPDGRSFVMIEPIGAVAQTFVIVNWAQTLRRGSAAPNDRN